MEGTERESGKRMAGALSGGAVRAMARQLLPGMVLPAVLYVVSSRFLSTIWALVVASSVPVLDVAVALGRGRRPAPAPLLFVAMAGVSCGLSVWADSPMFVLAKSAVISAACGTAFLGSAVAGRPLCRTLALKLLGGMGAGTRERLAAQWSTRSSEHGFTVLSAGWGLLLLATALQQAVLATTLSPGAVLALQSPAEMATFGLGIAASVAYVRHAHPEIVRGIL